MEKPFSSSDTQNTFAENNAQGESNLHEIIRVFPQSPGVYRMYNTEGKICYIGKAKRLRSRVLSYFNTAHKREITNMLMRRVVNIDYLVTSSEAEALILESNLIKRHQPLFNIDLKDNKSYPYLLLQMKPFPRLIKTRSQKMKGDYFGPYTNVPLMEAYLQAINRLYPLKKCRQVRFAKGFKPCLYFHINECLDYCTGGVSEEKVSGMISEIRGLMRGNVKQVVEKLKINIATESSALNFEKAKMLKNSMDVLMQTSHRQAVTNAGENYFDCLGYTTSNRYLVIALLQYRDAKLVNKHVLDFATPLFAEATSGVDRGERDEVESKSEAMEKNKHGESLQGEKSNSIDNFQFLKDAMARFLYDYYKVNEEDVSEILMPQEFLEACEGELKVAIATAYSSRNKAREARGESEQKIPKLSVPLAGKKKNYVKLALVNAAYSLQELTHQKNDNTVMRNLKTALRLPRIAKIIESFDIANTEGSHIVAGMVRFVNGMEDKAGYRMFNISLTNKPNDYISMQEAVFRRYHRLRREKKILPDLVVIDGGKGQLSSAQTALKSLGLQNKIPMIALAKKEEIIYLPGEKAPIVFSHVDESLRFLVRVRNETHRFVNSVHAKKRGKAELEMGLQNIPGLGEKKINSLLARFNSVQEIADAEEGVICALPFFGKKDFYAMKKYFSSVQLTPMYKSNDHL